MAAALCRALYDPVPHTTAMRIAPLLLALALAPSTALAQGPFELAFDAPVIVTGFEDVAIIPREDIAVAYMTERWQGTVVSVPFNTSTHGSIALFTEYSGLVTGIAASADRSHVYVLEERSGYAGVVVHVLDTTGLPLMDIVPALDPVYGTGLDCDRFGNVYLTDPDRDQVLVFDQSWFVPANYGMSHVAPPDRTIGPLPHSGVVDVSVDFFGLVHTSYGEGHVAVHDTTGALWSLGGAGTINVGPSAAGIDAHLLQLGTLAPTTWVARGGGRQIHWSVPDGTPSLEESIPGSPLGIETCILATDTGPVEMVFHTYAYGFSAYRR